jgi:hypothetical protein
MRLFHASQASLSASFLAADARRSDKRTALPYIRLRDFVLMADHNASHHTSSASRWFLRLLPPAALDVPVYCGQAGLVTQDAIPASNPLEQPRRLRTPELPSEAMAAGRCDPDRRAL